jgi:hypothetical protein
LSAAYKSGDLAAIGTQQSLVAQLLQQYLAGLSSAPSSSTPATPSATPTK